MFKSSRQILWSFTRFKYLQIIGKFFVVSTALVRTGTNLPIIKEITPIKMCNFREKNLECGKFALIPQNLANKK
jgi:hypothetical protein